MPECSNKKCYSFAINPHCHGRNKKEDRDLCDVCYWRKRAEARAQTINIIFDGPPSPPAPRFVEVENDEGRSIRIGEWVELDEQDAGLWALRIKAYHE